MAAALGKGTIVAENVRIAEVSKIYYICADSNLVAL